MNNSKLILFLSCLAALTLTASVATAAPRGSGGHNFGSMPARGGQTFSRGGMGTFNNRNAHFRGFNNRGFNNRTFRNHPGFIGGFCLSSVVGLGLGRGWGGW